MKNIKTLIVLVLALGILLSACEPAAFNPPDETYPAKPDEQDINSGEEDPYPVESAEVEDAKGVDTYIVNPQVSDDSIKEHGEDINEFAADLYRKLSDQEGNLIFSPYSIYQAFLMTYVGANAETKAEIAEVLDIDLEDDNLVHQWMNALNLHLTTRPEFAASESQPLQFEVANALWAQKETHFEEAFLNKLSANYNAGLKLVDFTQPEEARQLINLWVEAQTNQKVKDLIPEGMLTEMTRLVITNAVYFKGAWQHQFDAANNTQNPFFYLDGSQISVEMMHTNFTGAGIVNDKYQAVSLPYEQSNFAMAAIMPLGDFKFFENELEDDYLEEILKSLGSSNAMITLTMPKFEIESSFSLAEQMQALGMTTAFDPNLADFSGTTGEKDLYIADVVHKAYIDVNEEGTEAAAATAIGMSTTSMPAISYEITLDHPFVYVIYDRNTGTIVFMGRVVAP